MIISHNLYKELSQLVDSDNGFYYVDQEYNDEIYRIFLYRLVGYEKFKLPSALNCRGTTFKVGRTPILASLPPHKFFNLHEGDVRSNVDFKRDIQYYMNKEYGSLLSTVFTSYGFDLKTKGSFISKMAIDARDYLTENNEFSTTIKRIMYKYNATLNFEWVSPNNRIVLNYGEPRMVLLNVRQHTGIYIDIEFLLNEYPILEEYCVKRFVSDNYEYVAESISKMSDGSNDLIEGFVFLKKNGDMFKVKTDQYVRLHHLKDSVNNTKKLFEIVLNRGHDDLIQLFRTERVIVDLIKKMDAFVSEYYNGLMESVETFYNDNKHLSTKDFAIKAMEENDKILFTILMTKYRKKSLDVVEFLIKNSGKILENYDD